MFSLVDFLTSFLWRKALMAATGFTWMAFVFTHMLGNLMVFAGPQTYNRYSYLLIHNPMLPVAELLLCVFVILHATTGIILWHLNFRAKPKKYAVSAKGSKASPVAARTMIFSGAFVAAFLVFHLATFKYGQNTIVVYDGQPMRDLYLLVSTAFKSNAYVAWYLIALALIGVHLSHGFASAFQSLGVNHPRYTPVIQFLGIAYAVVVSCGFMALPIYFKFFL